MAGKKRERGTQGQSQADVKLQKKAKHSADGKSPVGLAPTTNALGWDLIQKQADTVGMKNMILSPLSVVIVLGLAAAGADPERQAEMCKKVGIEGPADLQEAFIKLVRALGANTDQGTLTLANGVFTDGHCELEPAFEEHAKAFDADMRKFADLPSSTKAINKWIAELTRNLICDMLSKPDLGGIHLTLVNALAFKGSWGRKFIADETKTDYRFKVSSKVTAQVDMMFDKRVGVDTCWGEGYVAVRLPYKSPTKQAATSMIAYLPDPGKSLEDVIKEFRGSDRDPQFYSKVYAKFGFPKFTIETGVYLSTLLESMGFPIAGAYPGIGKVGGMDAELGNVLHRAIVKVDERGTEAAAVTIMVGRGGGKMRQRPLPTLIFDRPFAFVIRAEESKAVLFTGVFSGT